MFDCQTVICNRRVYMNQSAITSGKNSCIGTVREECQECVFLMGEYHGIAHNLTNVIIY